MTEKLFTGTLNKNKKTNKKNKNKQTKKQTKNNQGIHVIMRGSSVGSDVAWDASGTEIYLRVRHIFS